MALPHHDSAVPKDDGAILEDDGCAGLGAHLATGLYSRVHVPVVLFANAFACVGPASRYESAGKWGSGAVRLAAMAARPRHQKAERSLPALRWVAEEELVYDAATNTLHRPGCAQAVAIPTTTSVPAGASLELVWAPRVCECRPDVTLASASASRRSPTSSAGRAGCKTRSNRSSSARIVSATRSCGAAAAL